MTETDAAPRKVPSDELLSLRESAWAPRLRSVSLVTEYQVKDAHAAQALTVLARLYQRMMNFSSAKAHQLLRRWPAVQVISMVSTGIVHYDHGNYWSPFFTHAAMKADPDHQYAWGTAFLDNLRALGLTDFSDSDDAGSKFVGRVLMHAGIPTYCLRDYFQLVVERRRLRPDLEPETFVAWAAERAAQNRLANVDKPVVRFLRYGGDYAIDLADRTFELLDVVAAGGDGAQVPLPTRFLSAASEFAADGVPTPARQRPMEIETRAIQPYLAIDAYGRGPMLRLPAVTDVPDGVATWQVIVDGRRDIVQSRALWPGSAEPAPETDFPILRPSRTAAVALGGYIELQSSISIIDEQDPLLAFNEDGKHLPGSLPFPRSPVWLLYPYVENEAEPFTVEGEWRVIATGLLPAGWSGWKLVLVDLANVRTLTVANSTRRHAVRGVEAAKIRTEAPVVDMRTPYGSLVYATAPTVELPASAGDAAEWQLTITNGIGEVLSRKATSQSGNVAGLWDGVKRPLLGSFGIRVRGPWGRGAARRVVLVEGLTTRSDPPWRRFARGGLVPAIVKVQPADGMTTDHSTVSLDRSTTRAHIVLTTPGETESFVLEPPHMTVSYENATAIGHPSVLPVPLETEGVLDDPGTLVVDIGAVAEPRLRVLAGGAPIQVVDARGRSATGVFRFDLARIVDTLRTHRVVTLSLDDRGELSVSAIRPRKLTTAVSAADGVLTFSDSPVIPGLGAAVYLLRAPWRGALSLQVTAGRAQLPVEYVGAGPMLVTLRVEDPWIPAPLPAWPSTREAMLLADGGWLESDDAEESELSAFLAGLFGMPSAPQRLDRIWAVLDRADDLQLNGRARNVQSACARELLRRPAEALLALEATGLELDRVPRALIQSGIAWAAVGEVDQEHAARLWASSPAIAALLSTGHLRNSQATKGDDVELVDAIIAKCGPIADDLLNGKRDPSPYAGRFDEAADRYALMSDMLRDAFRAALALVPHGLLDQDTRTQGAMSLLEHRSDWRLVSVCKHIGRMLREGLPLLERTPDRRLAAAVRARMHPKGGDAWRGLSALSLALAVLSRQASRGDAAIAAWLTGSQSHWGNLARVAPDLVTIDIVLAELLSVAAERSGREIEG